MEYIRTEGSFPRMSRTLVTLGKFDGVHRGHRKLIADVLEKKQDGSTAVLFAFSMAEKTIYTSRERIGILERAGIDILIECPLTEKIRSMKPDAFVREVLVGDLGASSITVGEDFRFGHDRKGTPETLRSLGKHYGFDTVVFPKEMEGHRKISSTYVREELKNGRMEKVNSLLGEPYFLETEIVHGAGLGHKRLLPTINQIPSEDKLLPPNGVYVTEACIGEKSYYGMTNIGYKPTVDGTFLGVETYLFDCSEDLYGQNCRLSFLHYQRPEKKFAGIDKLKSQLMTDKENALEWLERKNTSKPAK